MNPRLNNTYGAEGGQASIGVGVGGEVGVGVGAGVDGWLMKVLRLGMVYGCGGNTCFGRCGGRSWLFLVWVFGWSVLALYGLVVRVFVRVFVAIF